MIQSRHEGEKVHVYSEVNEMSGCRNVGFVKRLKGTIGDERSGDQIIVI